MTPIWNRSLDGIRQGLQVSHLTAFSIAMVGMLLAPMVLFFLGAGAGAYLSAKPEKRRAFMAATAYPLVGVALLYHLAHNAGHFFVEGTQIIPVLSDPFGWGWNLFGTAGFLVVPLLSMGWIWILQVGLVVAGHWAATVATLDVSHRMESGRNPELGRAVLALLVYAFTALNLWLLAQPMEMRTGL